jgi:hypothetical protein
MKVPLVVNTASRMSAVIATDGPATHSHVVTPRKPGVCIQPGGSPTPTPRSRLWSTPSGLLNQFGPLAPKNASTWLTAPEAVKRNSHTVVIAIELVTDGK